jgi:hypothetical protein
VKRAKQVRWAVAALIITCLAVIFFHGPFDRIHQWNCDRIKEGMAHDDVAAILGRHSQSFIPGVGEGPTDVVRVWTGRTDWRMILVIFDDNGKVKKAMFRGPSGFLERLYDWIGYSGI